MKTVGPRMSRRVGTMTSCVTESCSGCVNDTVWCGVQMVEEGSTLLRRMEICVAEAEKRSGKNAVNMQETFTVYLIETR